MKASFKATYQTDKGAAASPAAAATVTFNAGDIKLRASLTDATVVNGPSLNGLALAVEKPGFFIVDYNVPKQDVKFQFMNTIKIAEKQLNLNYTHNWRDNDTALDGTLVLDSASKVSVNHVLGTGNCKFKYTFVQGGLTTFEPSYEWGKNSWDFAISRRVFEDDLLKASYQTSSKNLGFEWSKNNSLNGSFKIAASFNLAEEMKFPKLTAETTWDFEMMDK